MEALQNLLNGENGSAIQLILITVVLVIGLILLVWIFRRIAGSPSRRAARNRVPRLSITDSAAVDDKRYLVLVRRDNVEHLVLIGGPTDVVVESGIVRVQPAVQSKTADPKPAAEETTAPALEETPPAPAPVAAAAAAGATVAAAATSAQAATPAPEETAAVETVTEPEEIEVVSENQSEPDAALEPDAVEEVVPEEIEEAVASIEIDPEDFATEPSPEVDSDVSEEDATVEPVIDEPETSETPQEADLEEAISAQLDDALSSEEFAVDSATDEKPAKSSDAEDDMQRLLDELAGETKEPA